MRSSAERLGRGTLLAALVGALAACAEPPADQTANLGRQEPPRAVETPPPDYPEALACDGVGGTVDLRVTIAPDGSVGPIKLQGTSGNQTLDEAAIAAVRTWRFKPATRGGEPFPFTISVPLTFNPPVERPERCFALDEGI